MAENRHLARLDALERSVETLSLMIQRLNAIVSEHTDTIGDTALDAAPTYTERLNLDSTIKDGWRPKEATVTVANAKGDEATREERRRRLAELIEDGQAVADQMNSQRDQVKRFA